MAAEGRRPADPMTKTDGPSPPSVADRLFSEGFAFDFFQAVRLLHALEPGRAPVGRGGPPSAEAVRFRAHASLGFPASTIHDLSSPAESCRPPELIQSFLGLTGPSGVLPRHYTELLIRPDLDPRGPERHAFRDWLDLFNHRLTALFYRAWEKYRPFLERERDRPDRPEVAPGTFTLGLLSLIGLGMPSLRNRLVVGPPAVAPDAPGRDRVDDLALVHYSGLLSRRTRSADGLRAILLDYFGLPVEILQFRGRWLAIDPRSRTRLAEGRASNRLGVDAVIGERVWDVQSLFRVRLGPLTYGQFRAFLPDRSRGRAAFLLAHLVRLYVGPELDFDLQLVLEAGEVPQCQLPIGLDEGPVLGWNSWLSSAPPVEDADDAVFADSDLVA